jgi:hypothetical protein
MVATQPAAQSAARTTTRTAARLPITNKNTKSGVRGRGLRTRTHMRAQRKPRPSLPPPYGLATLGQPLATRKTLRGEVIRHNPRVWH